jgi:hypothetical protein
MAVKYNGDGTHYWAPEVLPFGRYGRLFKDAPSPPTPPDYAGAATAQGIANLEAARATSKLNNPNIVGPTGTQTVQYGINGDPDQAQVTQTLSPEQQAIYNKQVQVKGLLGDLGITGANALQGVVGKSVDFAGAPAAPGSSQALRSQVIDAQMARVNEDANKTREQKNSDLIAAGIRPGTQAYDDQMNLIQRGVNDAKNVAINNAGAEAQRSYGMDQASRKDYIAELLARRQTPLNEINALMSGSQVSNPFAGNLGFQGGASAAPAPIFNAAQAQGQAEMNNYQIASNAAASGNNSMMSGLGTLGSAAMTMMF